MGCSSSQQDLTNNHTLISVNSTRYSKTDLIAIGTHASVYKCIREESGSEYAMKIIHLDGGGVVELEKMQQLRRLVEFRQKGLSNSNLVQFIEMQVINNELYIIMELGTSNLKTQIQKQGNLSQERSSRITHSILLGLQQLHNAQMIHKHLRSTNIICLGDTYKISDWQLAPVYEQLLNIHQKQQQTTRKQDRLSSGSKIKKKKEFSKQVDIWHIGCIVIEMITGKSPYQSLKAQSKATKDAKTSSIVSQLPKNISKQCRQFLNSCLNVNPAKRPKINDLLTHPFIKKHQKVLKNEKTNLCLKNMQHQKQNPPSKSSKNTNQKGYSNAFSAGQSTVVQELDVLQNLTNHKLGLGRQINEPQQDQQSLYVYINNKKTKIDRSSYKKSIPKQIQQNRPFRNSIQLQSHNISKANQSMVISKVKMETQPAIINLQINRQSFKKPLKLLKKKLRQKKASREILKNSFQSPKLQLKNLYNLCYSPRDSIQVKQQEPCFGKLKKRSSTSQQCKQIVAINTHIAQAERDRYLGVQNVMRKQRQIQRVKWQQELNRQAQAHKRQFAYRYGYKRMALSNQ